MIAVNAVQGRAAAGVFLEQGEEPLHSALFANLLGGCGVVRCRGSRRAPCLLCGIGGYLGTCRRSRGDGTRKQCDEHVAACCMMKKHRCCLMRVVGEAATVVEGAWAQDIGSLSAVSNNIRGLSGGILREYTDSRRCWSGPKVFRDVREWAGHLAGGGTRGRPEWGRAAHFGAEDYEGKHPSRRLSRKRLIHVGLRSGPMLWRDRGPCAGRAGNRPSTEPSGPWPASRGRTVPGLWRRDDHVEHLGPGGRGGSAIVLVEGHLSLLAHDCQCPQTVVLPAGGLEGSRREAVRTRARTSRTCLMRQARATSHRGICLAAWRAAASWAWRRRRASRAVLSRRAWQGLQVTLSILAASADLKAARAIAIATDMSRGCVFLSESSGPTNLGQLAWVSCRDRIGEQATHGRAIEVRGMHDRHQIDDRGAAVIGRFLIGFLHLRLWRPLPSLRRAIGERSGPAHDRSNRRSPRSSVRR